MHPGKDLRLPAWALVCALALPFACDNPGPPDPVSAPPSANRDVTIRVTNMETSSPVSGARVVTNGRDVTTSGDGRANIGALSSGADVTIEHVGFLRRETKYMGSAEFGLWPVDAASGYTAEYTRQIVYVAPNGESLMLRLLDSAVYVVPDAGYRRNVRAMQVLDEAAQKITSASGITYQIVESRPPGGVYVDVRIEPNNLRASGTGTCIAAGQGAIQNCLVTFPDEDKAKRINIVLHELGHTAGLRHSPNAREIMGVPYGAMDFSPNEIRTLANMYRRQPGNRYPDNDR